MLPNIFLYNTSGFGQGLSVIYITQLLKAMESHLSYKHAILNLKYFKEITFLHQTMCALDEMDTNIDINIHIYVPCLVI